MSGRSHFSHEFNQGLGEGWFEPFNANSLRLLHAFPRIAFVLCYNIEVSFKNGGWQGAVLIQCSMKRLCKCRMLINLPEISLRFCKKISV
jgi:hypothetical protein